MREKHLTCADIHASYVIYVHMYIICIHTCIPHTLYTLLVPDDFSSNFMVEQTLGLVLLIL